MAEREIYVVTKRAGPRLDGRRVKAEEELLLTENEARAHVLGGALVKKGETLPASFSGEASEKLQAIRANAKGADLVALPGAEPPLLVVLDPSTNGL